MITITARPLNPADPYLPYLRPLLQVVPGEQAVELSLELVVERFGVVVVDQDEGLPGLRALKVSKIISWRWRGAISRTSSHVS